MNLYLIDWIIVGGMFVFVCGVAITAYRYTKSVADFLAANRCAGRYVIAIADGIAGLGAISVVGLWQMYYEAGFTGLWWQFMMFPIGLIISVTGYIIYRYRKTRVLTLAQLFEVRYSRNFRVFAGIMAFIAGILNLGIFPAVGANFFIYFCGLPEAFTIGGLTLTTFPVVMILLLGVSISFTWMGGQIAIVLTDFFQGIFCNIVFIVALVYVFWVIDWGTIGQALAIAPEGQSMVHPFKGGEIKNFNFWYYIISAVGVFYTYKAWQGQQGYNCCAKSPHEAKMAGILGGWRAFAQTLLLVILPIAAFVLMNHPSHVSFASEVNAALGHVGNGQVQNQMTVPVVMSRFLPVGIRGLLAAVMLAAFISTHDTYLHSWGSIFIQDVIMPFRKKPLKEREHLWLLRFSILGVAIFIFFFSLFFDQGQAILMFFALTATIFLGGAGAAIVGGLYWKRGTTNGAWVSMIVGSLTAVGGFVFQRAWPIWFGVDFPITSQWVWAFAMGASSFVYVVVSLIDNKVFNLDKMLHRGIYTIKEDVVEAEDDKTIEHVKPYPVILQRLGLSHEFTRTDKIIFWATIFWSMLWFTIFIVGTIYNLFVDVSDSVWLEYWKIYSWIILIMGALTTLWFTIGGLANIKQMFIDLSRVKRDVQDDGMVVDHHNLSDHFTKKDES